MYDKLGALLSEALRTGEIPKSSEDSQKVDFFYVPEDKKSEDLSPPPPKKKTIPKKVREALAFIGISENANFDEAKKIYREKLMYYHPDRRADNPVLQKVAKEKTARLLKEWEAAEEWYESSKTDET